MTGLIFTAEVGLIALTVETVSTSEILENLYRNFRLHGATLQKESYLYLSPSEPGISPT
jgi:predicted nuclease of predicted toxin-antitoxin system